MSSSEDTCDDLGESPINTVRLTTDQKSTEGRDVYNDNRLIGLIQNIPGVKFVMTRMAERHVSDGKNDLVIDDGDGVVYRGFLQSCIVDETSSSNKGIGKVHCHSEVSVFFDTDIQQRIDRPQRS